MGKMVQLALLIPVLPLMGFLLVGIGRRAFSKSITSIIGCGSVLVSFVLSLLFFINPEWQATFHFFNFISLPTLQIGFDFTIDHLTALFLLIITGIGFLIHLYSSSYMHEENDADFARYFSYLNLFVFSMLLLVLGSNFIVMFIGWEGVGLCSYLLIGYWFKNPSYGKAAQKAFVMNRIGDLGFLLAIFWVVSKTGTTSFHELLSSASLAKLTYFDISAITLLLLTGATGKSAQVPLYTWLPDAMAGPTPVSALIHAATMVTAGIYMVARTHVLFSMAPLTQNVIISVGIITSLLAATIALKQNDIKKVLAYSTVSQLGLMFIALGTGAYTAAVFHVMTHAFFKALLFLGAGSVIHAMGGEQDLRNMGGLKKHLPITHITFLIGCLAIAGLPPFSGFFSKDEILLSVYAKSPIIYGFCIVIPILTAFYMFRLYALAFLGMFRGTESQHHHVHESPLAMTLPLIMLALLSIAGGVIGIPESISHSGHWLASYLSPVFAQSHNLLKPHVISPSTEHMLMAIAVGVSLIPIIIATKKYAIKAKVEEAPAGFIGNLLENKWFVDECYEALVSKPLMWLSVFFQSVLESRVIDGLVNGVGRLVNFGSRQLRWVQNGQVGSYVLFMTFGLLILLIIKLFL